MFERPGNLLCTIDLTGTQAFEQIFRREVEIHYLIRLLEKGIGDRFTDGDVSRLLDEVIEAFQVLDVHGADNVNPGIEQFEHILITLLIAGSWNVCMGKFIDDGNLRPSSEHRVQIHLLHHHPAILKPAPWNDFKSLDEGCSLSATMWLDEGQDHVYTTFLEGMGFL